MIEPTEYPIIVLTYAEIPRNRIPVLILRDLGIQWKRTVGKCWDDTVTFVGCENIPEELPPGLVVQRTPEEEPMSHQTPIPYRGNREFITLRGAQSYHRRVIRLGYTLSGIVTDGATNIHRVLVAAPKGVLVAPAPIKKAKDERKQKALQETFQAEA